MKTSSWIKPARIIRTVTTVDICRPVIVTIREARRQHKNGLFPREELNNFVFSVLTATKIKKKKKLLVQKRKFCRRNAPNIYRIKAHFTDWDTGGTAAVRVGFMRVFAVPKSTRVCARAGRGWEGESRGSAWTTDYYDSPHLGRINAQQQECVCAVLCCV